MRALCIPGRAPLAHMKAAHAHALTGEGDILQWTVLTFDDATAARLAVLYNHPSEGAGLDPDALVAR